ncbi:tyrosine-type recombinase/integrase [Bariatricus sp. SGI.154]|uniref:site-specific integrase n=1 Tax=Bariatricus sp. SGI.154 TaxID=3420549 RepID=UPI003D091A89
MMGRRGENIRKRKDGRWEARILCSYNSDGKAKYHSLYGKSYLEVKEKRNKLLGNQMAVYEKSIYKSNQKVTFGCIMTEWLDIRKDSVKESTYAHYVNLVEKHILPELGELYLSAVTSGIIDTFLRNKLHSGRLDGKGGLSPKTVADIRSILLLGLEYAKQQQYPCIVNNKVFYPKSQQPNIKVLTREEQVKLEKVLFQHPEPLELGIITTLYGGLRIGEICALQWKDFDFESGIVSINKTIIRIQDLSPGASRKTKILIDCPKTEQSNRIIPLPTFIFNFLKKYQMGPEIYVLTGTKTYLEPRVCLEKYKKILVKADLPSFSFHALRHTFATRCVESGFDTKSLSEILGHANVNTTLQRYVHPSIELKKEQMERLEQITIRGQNNGHKNI